MVDPSAITSPNGGRRASETPAEARHAQVRFGSLYWRGFGSAVAIGAAAGLAHALAETLLVSWCGVRIGWLDMVLTGLILGVTITAGLAAWWAVAGLVAPIQRSSSNVPAPVVARRILLFALLAGYCAGAALLSGRRAGWELSTILLSLWTVGLMLIAYGMLWRRCASYTGVALGALIAACAAFATTTWAQQNNEVVGTIRWLIFSVGLYVPALMALALLSRVRPRSSVGGPAGPLAGLAVVTAAVIAVAAVSPRPHAAWQCRIGPVKKPPRGSPPNVVMIVLDTLTAVRMERFGYERATMPGLTRFAEQHGDVVMSSQSPATWTGAAHASMFTGAWPSSHGCRMPRYGDPDPPASLRYPMFPHVPTLAEYLGGHGYRTAALFSNFSVPGLGLERGFDDVDTRPGDGYVGKLLGWAYTGVGPLKPGGWVWNNLPPSLRRHCLGFDRLRPPDRRADEMNVLARRWIETHGAQPYFLCLNYFDPHEPYLPRKAESLPGADRPGFGLVPNKLYNAWLEGRGEMPAALVQELAALYDEELRDLDRAVVDLLEWFRARTDFDRTLLIIVSDHGEEFMEHGLMRHGTDVYQQQIAVPLFIRLPRPLPDDPIEPGPQFQLTDLFATIAEIIGDPHPPKTEGSPWGRGRDYALTEMFVHRPGVQRIDREMHAVTFGAIKYIQSRSATVKEEMYDLAADPQERDNILASHPDLAERARQILAERQAMLDAQGTRQVREQRTSMEALRHLGYLDTEPTRRKRPPASATAPPAPSTRPQDAPVDSHTAD
ncbi:MAG: sulfatase-like hydrolase/transferase [Phycisphaerae bacterium]|nr:sulfatase-like hydrolase/transferase [Phycisphaerae bacterium]